MGNNSGRRMQTTNNNLLNQHEIIGRETELARRICSVGVTYVLHYYFNTAVHGIIPGLRVHSTIELSYRRIELYCTSVHFLGLFLLFTTNFLSLHCFFLLQHFFFFCNIVFLQHFFLFIFFFLIIILAGVNGNQSIAAPRTHCWVQQQYYNNILHYCNNRTTKCFTAVVRYRYAVVQIATLLSIIDFYSNRKILRKKKNGTRDTHRMTDVGRPSRKSAIRA